MPYDLASGLDQTMERYWFPRAFPRAVVVRHIGPIMADNTTRPPKFGSQDTPLPSPAGHMTLDSVLPFRRHVGCAVSAADRDARRFRDQPGDGVPAVGHTEVRVAYTDAGTYMRATLRGDDRD